MIIINTISDSSFQQSVTHHRVWKIDNKTEPNLINCSTFSHKILYWTRLRSNQARNWRTLIPQFVCNQVNHSASGAVSHSYSHATVPSCKSLTTQATFRCFPGSLLQIPDTPSSLQRIQFLPHREHNLYDNTNTSINAVRK